MSKKCKCFFKMINGLIVIYIFKSFWMCDASVWCGTYSKRCWWWFNAVSLVLILVLDTRECIFFFSGLLLGIIYVLSIDARAISYMQHTKMHKWTIACAALVTNLFFYRYFSLNKLYKNKQGFFRSVFFFNLNF